MYGKAVSYIGVSKQVWMETALPLWRYLIIERENCCHNRHNNLNINWAGSLPTANGRLMAGFLPLFWAWEFNFWTNLPHYSVAMFIPPLNGSLIKEKRMSLLASRVAFLVWFSQGSPETRYWTDLQGANCGLSFILPRWNNKRFRILCVVSLSHEMTSKSTPFV